MIERNLSLDILRILACLAVIMIHTAGSPIFHNFVSSDSYEYTACMIFDALCRWSVPVFAMLTGFFMLDSKKELPLKKLFSKYILRLVIALTFWSVVYAFLMKQPYYPLGTQEGHFWYVGMCIGLYLAMPVMRMVAANENLLAYFCWTWLAFKLYQFIGHYVALPINMHDVIFVDYVGYCLFAYYLKKLSTFKSACTAIYLLGTFGLIATIIIGIFTTEGETFFYEYTAPNVIMTAMGIFMFFLRHSIKTNEPIAHAISTVSQCTFGIYLVHLLVMYYIFFRLHRFIPNAIPLCLVCATMTFLIGGGISLIIKKIPVVGKWVV